MAILLRSEQAFEADALKLSIAVVSDKGIFLLIVAKFECHDNILYKYIYNIKSIHLRCIKIKYNLFEYPILNLFVSNQDIILCINNQYYFKFLLNNINLKQMSNRP